jgi:Fe-S-cluster containining protein
VKKQFYKDGIRFECRVKAGAAYHEGLRVCISRLTTGGALPLTSAYRRRSLPRWYAEKEDGLYHLKYTDKDCPFLKSDRCEVYESRPWQCRTWPFWPENMDSDRWEREVAAYCPGVGKGRLYTAEDIDNILRKKKDVSGCAMNKHR